MARDASWAPKNHARHSNLSEQQLNRLDESGIIYVGAEVQPGDTLVGKVTQRAKPRSRRKKSCCAPSSVRRPRTKNTSLRVDQGSSGTVIDAGVHP